MKISKKIISISLLSLVLILSGCNKATNESSQIISSPSKIIAYNKGLTKTLTSKDKEYENIVNLTNARIEKDELSVVKDGGDIANFVNREKLYATAIEFIYDEETQINIENSNGFSPIKFHKLFFILNKDNDNYNTFFEFGNKDNYVESSRGPITESKELLEVVKSIFK